MSKKISNACNLLLSTTIISLQNFLIVPKDSSNAAVRQSAFCGVESKFQDTSEEADNKARDKYDKKMSEHLSIIILKIVYDIIIIIVY